MATNNNETNKTNMKATIEIHIYGPKEFTRHVPAIVTEALVDAANGDGKHPYLSEKILSGGIAFREFDSLPEAPAPAMPKTSIVDMKLGAVLHFGKELPWVRFNPGSGWSIGNEKLKSCDWRNLRNAVKEWNSIFAGDCKRKGIPIWEIDNEDVRNLPGWGDAVRDEMASRQPMAEREKDLAEKIKACGESVSNDRKAEAHDKAREEYESPIRELRKHGISEELIKEAFGKEYERGYAAAKADLEIPNMKAPPAPGKPWNHAPKLPPIPETPFDFLQAIKDADARFEAEALQASKEWVAGPGRCPGFLTAQETLDALRARKEAAKEALPPGIPSFTQALDAILAFSALCDLGD